MLSLLAIFSLFAYIIYKALGSPWIGVVGFYAFLTLDPLWNWRWVMPQEFRFQFYIFIAIVVGFFLNAKRNQISHPLTQLNLYVGILLYLILLASQQSSIAPLYSARFMGVYWKTQIVLLLLVTLTDTPKKIFVLLTASLAGVAYNSYQVNLEYFNLGYCRYARMTFWGSYGLDNNTLSIMLVPSICIGIALLFTQSRLCWKAFGLASAILIGHQLMLFESRGTWLGALVSLALLAIFMPKRKHNLTFSILIAFAVSALAGPPVIREWNTIFVEDEEKDSSAKSRYDLWRAGWEITLENPLFGVGPNAARILVPTKVDNAGEAKALHNLFFDISTSGGFPALLLYLIFVGTPWLYCLQKYSRRNSDDPHQMEKYVVITALPGFWVASCFSSAPLLETSYLVVGVGYCIANSEFRTARQLSVTWQQKIEPKRQPAVTCAQKPDSFKVREIG